MSPEALCDDSTLQVFERVPLQSRRTLRLVCRRWKTLVDARMCPSLAVHGTSHLTGGRVTGAAVYRTQIEFQAAAARVLGQRAVGLAQLRLDTDAYGCKFASQLLKSQALPQLRAVALQNAEAKHVAALRTLPRLRSVCLSRHINGPVTAGPAAELLVCQLHGLPLRRLSLAGYCMQPGVLCSIAEALPALADLVLEVERVEEHGRLELAALPQLQALKSFELRLPVSCALAAGTTVAPFPPGAASMGQLTSLVLAHLRPGQGEQEAFWASLEALPALQRLSFVDSGHSMRQPPHALLNLSTLTSLHIEIQGTVYSDDPPNNNSSQLPELPDGALPRLSHLHVSSVGLQAFPASWCKLPLRQLQLSGHAIERSAFYCMLLPAELPALAPTLRRLELTGCGLLALPAAVLQLTGLTRLGLRRNCLARLPDGLRQLPHLEEIDLWQTMAANVGQALQGCAALRRIDMGSAGRLARRRTLDGGRSCEIDDCEPWLWEDAWMDGIRALLPWVTEVGCPTDTAAPHWP